MGGISALEVSLKSGLDNKGFCSVRWSIRELGAMAVFGATALPSWRGRWAVAGACGAVGLACLAQYLLFGSRSLPLLLVQPTLVLCAWFCGMRAAFIATVLAAILCNFLFFQHHLGLDLGTHALGSLVVFLAASLSLSFFIDAGRRALEETDRARRQVEEENQRRLASEEALTRGENVLRHALHAANMVAWEWDVESDLISYSENYAEVLGLPPDAPIRVPRLTVFSNVHPDDRATIERATRMAFEDGQPFRAEFRRFAPGCLGPPRWFVVHGHAMPQTHETPRRIVGVSVDIDARKRAELALVRQAEELARSNGDLERFAFVASHDLKEPLRTVGNSAQLLHRQLAGQLSPDAATSLRHIVAGTRRMHELVENLLHYARAGMERPRERIATGEVVAQVLESLKEQAREAQAVFTVDALPDVLSDETSIARLFQNLLANALRYRGDRAPAIRVGIREGVGTAVIFVRDNGPGIEPELHERIFEQFARGSGSEEAGSGLGLAICRRIVERHGGRIWVESALGEGATFFFTLPQATERTHESFSSRIAEPQPLG